MVSMFEYKRVIRRYLRACAWLLAVAIVLSLFVGGAQPVAVNLVPAPWDKLAHASVFALLAIAIGLASGLTGWRMLMLAVFSVLLVGALDEWHQAFLPGRQAGWDDLMADTLGGVLGAGLLYGFLNARHNAA